MGYESDRFTGEVDEELKCPICCMVLSDAVQAPQCEHTFCHDCISSWLTRQSSCPVDRQPLSRSDLKPAPRVLRNLLAKLELRCDFDGCQQVVKLELLQAHRDGCDFNPDKSVMCSKGCGLEMRRNQVDGHNCLSDLRNLVTKQASSIAKLKTHRKAQAEQIVELKERIKRMQEHEWPEQQRQLHHLQQQVSRLLDSLAAESESRKRLSHSCRDLPAKRLHPSSHEAACCSGSVHKHLPSHYGTHDEWRTQHITFYGEVLTLSLRESESVADVKQKVAGMSGIPLEQQQLFFAGQQLEDERPLSYYGLWSASSSDSSRHLVLRLRDGMKIYVKTLSDKTIEVQVDPSETVEIVKVKIHEQEGISPCDQRLLTDGRDLNDMRTLSEYGIKHRSTLQLDLHLGGPCPICQTQFRSSSSSSLGSPPPHPLAIESGRPASAGKGACHASPLAIAASPHAASPASSHASSPAASFIAPSPLPSSSGKG